MTNNLPSNEQDKELNESELDKVNGGVLWDGKSLQPDHDDADLLRTAKINDKII